MGWADECERRRWGLLWSSLWGNETLYLMGRPHAHVATEPFGGAPYGAKVHCIGRGRRMQTSTMRNLVEHETL
eukprot:6240720-Pyramimonas_sp.AAC.1